MVNNSPTSAVLASNMGAVSNISPSMTPSTNEQSLLLPSSKQ
jgi:hypothetical protein